MRRVGGHVMRNSAQGNHAGTVRGVQINLIQAAGVLPKLRFNFHDDIILVQRSVHGGNLLLSKSIVNGAVNELRGYAEAGGGIAVINERSLKAVIFILLVAVHIGKPVQFLHMLEEDRPPFVEVVQVFALDRVLVLRVLRRHRRSWPGWRKTVAPGTTANLGRSRLMT